MTIHNSVREKINTLLLSEDWRAARFLLEAKVLTYGSPI